MEFSFFIYCLIDTKAYWINKKYLLNCDIQDKVLTSGIGSILFLSRLPGNQFCCPVHNLLSMTSHGDCWPLDSCLRVISAGQGPGHTELNKGHFHSLAAGWGPGQGSLISFFFFSFLFMTFSRLYFDRPQQHSCLGS